MSTFRSGFLLAFFITFLLSACGGGGSKSSGNEDEVNETLTNLGVDTDASPREDSDSEPLPDDYSPLGSSKSFEQFDELVMLGFPLSASSGFDSEMTLLELDRIDTSASYDTDVLFSPGTDTTPWAVSAGDAPAALRVAARGDIDQDGLEELIVVYRAPGESSVELQVYDDQEQNFAKGQTLVISTEAADSLAIGSGDFNGDSYADLAIGLVSGSSVQLLFVDNDAGILSLSTVSKILPQAVPDSKISLIIKSGNLDYDPSHEMVVLVNEIFGNPETGTSRYFIFDDAKKDRAEISNALVQSTEVNRTAIVADVSLGDVDGDNLDEIVFGGLTHFDPNGQCSYNYLLMVLDDQVHDGTSLGAKEQSTNIFDGCATSKGELRFVHVNTPDLDGDGIAEIQANEFIYEDLASTPAWTSMFDANSDQMSIPQSSLFADDGDGGFTGRFSQQSSSMVVADLTSDKRQDIIFYSQSTNRLEVWGLSEPDPNLGVVSKEWRMLKSIPVATPTSADEIRPLLLPVNVNRDSLAISFDEGEYQLVFTEPVIIAALAAAPCYENLGQNTDACRTSFGSAESTTVALEDTLTISAGVTVGVDVEFNDPITAIKISEVSAKLKVSASLSLSHSASYTYTERVVYTTGPVEDTVIFTSIPYDRYTYTIKSHPDPDLIGTKIVVSMPRSPVTLQVERSFYNANVIHGGPKIDSTVFNHTAGDPDSYMSVADKDALMSRYFSLIPVTKWAYDFGPVSVGQGGGDTTLEINVATEWGTGVGVGIEAEFEAEATAGIIVAGFSVGVSREASLQIIHGSESTYTGTVSNLPPDAFATNSYSWGLFTYVMDDHPSGQQFEVLNYWVE